MAEEQTSEQKAVADAAEPVAAPTVVPAKKKAPTKKRRKRRAPAKKTTKKMNGPVYLSADDILGKKDLREEELHIDEWEGTVVVRGLSSVAHEKLVQSAMQGTLGAREFNMVGYQAKLAVLCSYDGFEKDGGKRIFQDAHAPMLMEKASGPVSKIATKAQELSGLGGAALEKLRANLGMTPSGDSLIG